MEAAKSAGWDTSAYEAQIQSIEAEASKLKKDMEANTQQLATATETLTQQSQKLNQTISDNAYKQAVAETGVVSTEDIASASGESYGAKVANAIKKKAQDNHRAELQADLQNAVQASMEDSDTAIKSGDKIGGKNAVNRKKVEETAILMQKLADVNNDRLMSTDEEAKAKTAAQKRDAYRSLLEEAGVSDKRIAAVLKVSDIDSIELDADGKVKDSKAVVNSIKTEWADFIQSGGKEGAKTPTPPQGSGKTMTKEDIMAIKNSSERQRAIAENHELFGF